jgi:hypothetical protein
MAPHGLQERISIITRMHKRKQSVLLSKFVNTRRCRRRLPQLRSPSSDGYQWEETVHEWAEFIEPITVHARHPFALASCQHIPAISKAFPNNGEPHAAPHAPIMDVDYILLKSGSDLHQSLSSGSHNKPDFHHTGQDSPAEQRYRKDLPRKHIMVDAGTSTFDSSLFWFTCAYSQVRTNEYLSSFSFYNGLKC